MSAVQSVTHAQQMRDLYQVEVCVLTAIFARVISVAAEGAERAVLSGGCGLLATPMGAMCQLGWFSSRHIAPIIGFGALIYGASIVNILFGSECISGPMFTLISMHATAALVNLVAEPLKGAGEVLVPLYFYQMFGTAICVSLYRRGLARSV